VLAASGGLAPGDSRANEGLEERMRLVGTALEFRVELASDEVRMIGEFDDFDESLVGARAAEAESGVLQLVPVVVVELEAVAMTLGNLGFSVDFLGSAAGNEFAGIRAESHRAALGFDSALIRHEVDDRVLRRSTEFDGVGAVEVADVSRVFDYRELHAEADPEEGNALFTCVADGVDLSFDAAISEPTGN